VTDRAQDFIGCLYCEECGRGGMPAARKAKAIDDQLKKLKEFVGELAEADCSYGDNCPDFAGTRHGKCLPCKAREALEE
jgi:hypothetical protein